MVWFRWRSFELSDSRRAPRVETDSFTYHRGSIAFEDDHARDLDLRRAGFAVLRYTGAQIRNQPSKVVTDLRAALEVTGRA
jgi:very-short-patch-repair endonuclease